VAIPDLKKKYNSKIIASTYDEKRIPDIDIKKKDGDFFSIGKTNFKVVHIPGHTLGHICFFSKQSKALFVGDTLFSLGCGRIFEGTFEQMFESLEKIKNLPKDTMIYCGHEYTDNNGKFCISIDKKMKNSKIELKKSKLKEKEINQLFRYL
jgi:hydroxyacylglutathione hydrolase